MIIEGISERECEFDEYLTFYCIYNILIFFRCVDNSVYYSNDAGFPYF